MLMSPLPRCRFLISRACGDTFGVPSTRLRARQSVLIHSLHNHKSVAANTLQTWHMSVCPRADMYASLVPSNRVVDPWIGRPMPWHGHRTMREQNQQSAAMAHGAARFVIQPTESSGEAGEDRHRPLSMVLGDCDAHPLLRPVPHACWQVEEGRAAARISPIARPRPRCSLM